MEEKRHNRKAAITSLLRMIDDGTTEAVELFNQWARRQPYRLDPEEQLAVDRMKERREYRNRLAYLRRKKLVKAKKIEGRLFVELSDQGRVELMKRTLRNRPKLPDDLICLTIYDVPIERKSSRNALRYFLKNIGFVRLQQSVWQTDMDVIEEVKAFVKSIGVQDWIKIYAVTKVC